MANLVFFDEGHRYELDGVPVPSVTEICSHLAPPANVPPETLRMAAQRGSLVHELCMLMDYDALPDEIPPEVVGYLEAYRKFLRDYRPDWIYVEYPVYSERNGFAGTLDRFGIIGGEAYVVDLKTTANMDRPAKIKAACQTFAYGDCLADSKHNIPQGMVVQLRKDGTYTAWTRHELELRCRFSAPYLFAFALTIAKNMGGYL